MGAIAFISLFLTACSVPAEQQEGNVYRNPVCESPRLPDPSLIRADGAFYLYATESSGRVPVMRSEDLVHWNYHASAFPEGGKPNWNAGYKIWAPCVNKIGDNYVMYYSLAKWGEHDFTGIGVAYSETPDGPWTDCGKLFCGSETGAGGCIDPCFVADESGNWLFWGSFRGIYAVRLSDDGLSVEGDYSNGKIKIAGTAYEGTYVFKKDGWYYLFASVGSCCAGANSTYKTVVGRSSTLLGPYLDRNGKKMLDNHHEVIIRGDARPFIGTGHNSEIVQDDEGEYWILYHAYSKDYIDNGRMLMLDRIVWKDGWPSVTVSGGSPTIRGKAPVFGGK